jgi:TRAP-type transport system periplasmic protein
LINGQRQNQVQRVVQRSVLVQQLSFWLGSIGEALKLLIQKTTPMDGNGLDTPMKKLIGIFTGFLMLASTAVGAATPPAKVLKAGHVLAADTPQGRGMRKFSELVEEQSKGRIRVEVHSSGKLGDDMSMVNALRQGTQDIASPDTSTLARFVKDFSVVNYPFTFLNESQADHVLDGPWGTQVMGALPAHGLVGLAFWENGFRHLTNSQRAITSMTQVKGIRMRTMQNQMLIDSFNELGFNAVPLPFPQVFQALADKEVDGQENPLPTILSNRFYEVQQHLTLSRHVYSAFSLLISKATWDAFAPADQAILAAAAIGARDFQRQVNRQVTAAALEQLQISGMRVTTIDIREAQAVRRRLRSVLERYNKDIGEGSVIAMYVALGQWRADAPVGQKLTQIKPAAKVAPLPPAASPPPVRIATQLAARG